MRRRINQTTGLVLVCLLIFSMATGVVGSPTSGRLDDPHMLTVGASGTYPTIESALEQADAGDTVKVLGGSYEGPLKITTPVTLLGRQNPTIEGSRRGTVVTIDTSHVTFAGFTVRGSGENLNREDAGISVNAPYGVVRDNRLKNVLFGIYLRRADSSRVVNNNIRGYEHIQPAERGDLIRVWYSDHVTVSHNYTKYGRDAVIWFANNIQIDHNTFTHGRYGLHFMYSDSAVIRYNKMLYNSVGAYLMYSRRLIFEHNSLAYNRSGSAMGVGLKAMDQCRIRKNAIVDNQIGIYVDNSPRSLNSRIIYEKNAVAYNDVGLQTSYAVPRSHFVDNSFMQNFKQVEISGNGSFMEEESSFFRKNYWSSYSGFDSDGNGIGEEPYRYTDFFATMSNQVPAMELYTYSPAVQALRLAARAFPLIRPKPRLKDSLPRMDPVLARQIPAVALPSRWPLAGVSVLLLGLGISFLWSTSNRQRDKSFTENIPDSGMKNGVRQNAPGSPPVGPSDEQELNGKQTTTASPSRSATEQAETTKKSLIEARNVTKYFGDQCALKNVSFALESGDSLALWGPNGAGKTTLLRCLLGVIPFEGMFRIEGERMDMNSKQLRQKIGFVPQAVSFYSHFTIREMLAFVSGLRHVESPDIPAVLDEVDLQPHGEKKIHALSGGMKQRLALAAALLGDPPILLLDEPMASLDLDGRRAFIDWLSQLHERGKTLILSTHHTDQIKALADRVLILDQGRLADDVSAQNFESTIKQ